MPGVLQVFPFGLPGPSVGPIKEREWARHAPRAPRFLAQPHSVTRPADRCVALRSSGGRGSTDTQTPCFLNREEEPVPGVCKSPEAEREREMRAYSVKAPRCCVGLHCEKQQKQVSRCCSARGWCRFI